MWVDGEVTMKKLKYLLQPGDKIELQIDLSGDVQTWESSVEEIIDNQKLLVHAYSDSAKPLRVKHKSVHMQTQKDSAGILKMHGEIVSTKQSGLQTFILIDLDEQIEQTQRRHYYRLPIFRNVFVNTGSDEVLEGLTQNISAGGLRCLFPEPLEEDTLVTTEVELGNEVYKIKGRVLEAMDFDEEHGNYVLRIQFMDTPEAVKAKLMRYILSEQSRLQKLKK